MVAEAIGSQGDHIEAVRPPFSDLLLVGPCGSDHGGKLRLADRLFGGCVSVSAGFDFDEDQHVVFQGDEVDFAVSSFEPPCNDGEAGFLEVSGGLVLGLAAEGFWVDHFVRGRDRAG